MDIFYRLLNLYLDRCVQRHVLAFLQFRKVLPNAHLHDLMEIFAGRKEFLLSIMKKIQKLVNQGILLKNDSVESEEQSSSDDELDKFNVMGKKREKKWLRTHDYPREKLIRCMTLDRENKIHFFKDLGMTDPFQPKKSMKNSISHVRTFDFLTEVYPGKIIQPAMEAMKQGKVI